MKYSKAVYVTSHDIIKGNLNREYDAYANRVVKNEKAYLETNYASKDFACQYDSNRDAVIICTCKRFKAEGYRYFNASRQAYTSQRYTSAEGFTDVGVGSVKTVQRKRVRRIYLPDTEDRGVGSSDLTSFIRKIRNGPSSYYGQKKTSSKCVGGVMEYNIPVINKKLSPPCKTKSVSTSPKKTSFEEKINIDSHYIIPDPVFNIVMGKKHVRGDNNYKVQGTTVAHETLAHNTNVHKNNELSLPLKIKPAPAVGVNEEKDFSSDSFVQQVHNLENTSSFNRSKTSIDSVIENKLEKDIKKFSTTSKQGKSIAEVHPVQDCSNESLRRQFEALRRGFSKKDVSVEHGIVTKSSSQNSTLSRKDVSISSDPPSLEARSYADVKIYSPVPSPSYKYEDVPQTSYEKSMTGKKRSSHWPTDVTDGDCQNVKGMLKLWEKKFNFEEDCYNKTSSYTKPDATTKQKKKVELVLPKEEVIETQKKEGTKFSFFKRINKERAKEPHKSKKSVTAGRCEVEDGLTIRIEAANEFTSHRTESEQIPDGYDDMLRNAWLKRGLDNKNDSGNSVKVRWNNEMYATSSSTVFEFMECIYKNTGILYTSRSEMTMSAVPSTTTDEIPYYHAHKNQQVNFMQQTVQAWMISKLMTDKSIEIQKPKNKNEIADSFSNQKWFIEKSKAFSQKIELVLHSNNFVKDDIRVANNSEYIVIDIPTGYFLETSSEDEQTQLSDEQVFNIVEYETAKSISYINKKRNDRKMDISDHENDIGVIANQNEHKKMNVLEKEIKTSLLHRDVVVQGSNVYVPKRCDVVSVGIITQHTHNRDIQKPILRMQDEMTDDESTNTSQKKCELAESYLQDYYRYWMPFGTDLYSWCSDSNLRASSDNNSLNSFNNQDGSKSCPNIYDDYQASGIVSSSRSQCMIFEESKAVDTTKTYFNKLKKKKNEPQLAGAKGKRVLPKDSMEVFKRRKVYAASKVKADWCADPGSEPLSKPSNLDKFAQKLSNDVCDLGNQKTKKYIKKRVSLIDFKKKGESIMSFKGSFGCKNCKTKEPCSKHALIIPEPMCEMLSPPCLDSCTKTKKPPCSKQGSPTCLVPPPPICSEGPPSPFQPTCPPISSPCASFLEGNSPSPTTLPPSSPSRSFSGLQPCPKKNSPLSSQRKPPATLSSPHTLTPHLPPTSPPTAKSRPFARFFSRRSKQKAPCIDSCSKLKKPPCLTKSSSPCTSLEEASSQLPPRSPPHRTKISPPSSQQTPPCKDSCSKLKKPPCSMRNSSPCASLEEVSSPSPPRSPTYRRKFSSPSSQQTPPCKDSCSKLKQPPCSTKSSSPYSPLPETSSPSSPRSRPPSNPSSPTRTKFSSQSSQQKPHSKDSCEKEKIPPYETIKVRCRCFPNPEGLTSLPKSHLRPTKSSPLTPRNPSEPTRPCGCNPQKSCGLPLCLSSKNPPSSSQEFPYPQKNQLSPKNSDISLKNSPSNKYTEMFKRLISKCSSLKTKKDGGDCDLDCPHLKAKVKKKATSIPSIPLIPPLPFCQPTSAKPRSHSKISGIHLKKLPMPQNLFIESKPSCKVIKLNSKENLTIRMKPKTLSTEAISDDDDERCNIKVVDEDGQTLYERREYKMDTAQAKKHLIQDMYRESRIHRVSTSNTAIKNEKKLNLCENKSKTSLSNIVEINLNIKLKQADKTTDVNIKRCNDTTRNNQNENVNSQELKNVYTLQDKTNQSIDRIVDAKKRDVGIKIIINSYQQNLNKSKGKIKHPDLCADEFSRKISEKFHTVSTGYSDVLDDQLYSVHRTTVNFTDYSDTSKHLIKPSEELVSEGLIGKDQINLTDIECETKHSKSEPSITLVTVNNTEKEDGPVLPSDISQIEDSVTNLENIVDTFDEKSATGISATDEEALLSDVQHSYAKTPKLHNKEEKKKMLKFIFEDSMKSKNTPSESKMRSLRKMLRAALTSDISRYKDDSFNYEVAKELAYESLKPNFFKNSESMTNYYQIDSSNSDNRSSLNEIDEIFHSTEINNNLDSAESTNEESHCLCSHLAAKLNLCKKDNFKACCCRVNGKRDEEIDCNLIEDVKTNKAKFVDVETQDCKLKGKVNKSGITIGSNTAVIKPREVKDNKKRKLSSRIPKRLFSYSSNVKGYKLNRQTILGLSDDDKVIVLNSEPDDSNSQEVCTNSAKLNAIDILQLYETKKAVLEIYAEKTVFNETLEHLVAKLPRFICQTESGICNYDEIFRFS